MSINVELLTELLLQVPAVKVKPRPRNTKRPSAQDFSYMGSYGPPSMTNFVTVPVYDEERLMPSEEMQAVLLGVKKEESFSEMLLRKIDDRIDEDVFKKDADCYNKVNMNRNNLSNVRRNRDFHPDKETVMKYIVALELPLAEAEELLFKAGYSISPAIKFDAIMKYHIEKRRFNTIDIDCDLYSCGLKSLFSNDKRDR